MDNKTNLYSLELFVVIEQSNLSSRAQDYTDLFDYWPIEKWIIIYLPLSHPKNNNKRVRYVANSRFYYTVSAIIESMPISTTLLC